MKIPTLFTPLGLSVLLVVTVAYGFTVKAPKVPIPKLTLSEAIKIADKARQKDDKLFLIGADWFKGSSFHPRISDGTQFHAVIDAPDEYCWYLTYISDEPSAGEDRTIWVIRVKEDGTIGRVMGTRT